VPEAAKARGRKGADSQKQNLKVRGVHSVFTAQTYQTFFPQFFPEDGVLKVAQVLGSSGFLGKYILKFQTIYRMPQRRFCLCE
jgi:hypothetical protein